MLAHIPNGQWPAAVVWLLYMVLASRARYRRFVALLVLTAVAVTVWWLLARGGILVIERDFIVPPPVTPRK